MRPSLQAMGLVLALTASLTWVAPREARAALSTAEGDFATVCEQNPHITPTLQICAFQRGTVRYYRIDDTHNGQHFGVAVMDDGAVTAFPVDQKKVHMSLSAAPTPEQAKSVYSDGSVDIALLQDAQQRLTWVVSPSAVPKLPRVQMLCSLAGCSVNRIYLSIE